MLPSKQNQLLRFIELEPGKLYKAGYIFATSDCSDGADNGGREIMVASDTLVLLVEIYNFEEWGLPTRLRLLVPDGRLLYTWGRDMSALMNF